MIKSLENTSWSEISEITQQGLASTYWKVGDTKKEGNFTCTIVDFNKDYWIKNNIKHQNTITFSLGDVGFGKKYTSESENIFIPPEDVANWSVYNYYFLTIKGIRKILSPELLNEIKKSHISYIKYTNKGPETLTGDFDLFAPTYLETCGGKRSYEYFKENPVLDSSYLSRNAAAYYYYLNFEAHYDSVIGFETLDASTAYNSKTIMFTRPGKDIKDVEMISSKRLMLLFVI